MPWSPGLMGGGTPARAQRFAGGPGAGGAAPWHGGCPPSSQLPSSPRSLSTEYFKTRLLQSESSDLGCRRGWGGANFCGGSLPPPPVPHAPCPPLPAPQLWTDRSGAAGRAAGTMAPAPSSCVTGRAPSSESQVRRSFRTVGSLRPFSCQPWAPAPGTKGLAGPGDSLHLRGVILGPETLVSTLAFCKFASLPPRRRLDPVLGLRVVPLCLSSLRF